MRKIIAVVGDAESDSVKHENAFELGKALIDNGYRVQSGGKSGVMESVFEGAKASLKYKEGDTIAIVPSFNPNSANPKADIVIPTGLDLLRDAIVVSASAVVAIGGGAGTLTEIAIAWQLRKLIIAYDNVDGWSSKVAGTKIDRRVRYSDIPDDRVYGVNSAEQTIGILKNNMDKYNRIHKWLR